MQRMVDIWKEQWQYLTEICKNPEQSLSLEECEAIFTKIAEPFKAKMNGCNVTVNAHDLAV